MKMNIKVHPIGPCVESETLLKFVIKKCAEIRGTEPGEPSPNMGISSFSSSCT